MAGDDPDYLTTDHFSALGERPVLVVDAARWSKPLVDIQSVIIGVDANGTLPLVEADHFDVLITSAADAPAPWVSVAALDNHVAMLAKSVQHWPMAATMLCQTLRLAQGRAFAGAIAIESLAYSTLLGGAEFARWRAGQPDRTMAASARPLVKIERAEDMVTLTLDHPESQNAMTAMMRDALHGALANALDDPTAPGVQLTGTGRCFSTGGALGEFGTASDLARAHLVRTLRSCALLLDRLGARAAVRLRGACVGSGIEIAAAAHHRCATADAWFQLPELRMGLIPGAGGTASVARAIGRQRTAWMLLSGKRIHAKQALDWGLVHEIVT
jgi:Enoyl-CoA hydratase/isomerase